jgi:hypothetical protein
MTVNTEENVMIDTDDERDNISTTSETKPTRAYQSYISLDSSTLMTLESSNALSDVIITFHGTERHLHKVILCIQSEYFRAAFMTFNNNVLDLSSCGFDSVILDAVFDFMYLKFEYGDIMHWILKGLSIDELKKAADYFLVTALDQLIHDALYNLPGSFELNPSNVLNCVLSLKEQFDNGKCRAVTWIFLYLQVEAMYSLKEHLHQFPLNILILLIKSVIKQEDEQSRFLLFLDVMCRLEEPDAAVIKQCILENFDFSLIEKSVSWKIVQSLDDAKKIYVEAADVWFPNRPLVFSRSFIMKKDHVKSIKVLFRHSNTDLKFKLTFQRFLNCYLYHDPHQVKGRLPEFSIMIANSKTYTELLSKRISHSEKFKMSIENATSKFGYGWTNLIASDYLTENDPYIVFFCFHGFVPL